MSLVFATKGVCVFNLCWYISTKFTSCNSQDSHFGSIFFFNHFFSSFPSDSIYYLILNHNNRWGFKQIFYLISRVASYYGAELFQILQCLTKFLSNTFKETTQFLESLNSLDVYLNSWLTCQRVVLKWL